MRLAERLVAIREQHGYTRKRLAEELGRPYATITKYETGEREPGFSYIVLLAEKFGVTTDYILGVSDIAYRIDPDVSAEAVQLSRDYDALPDRDRRVVRAVMSELRVQPPQAAERRDTKLIHLFGNSFAAGWGEPDFGNLWEDYAVPADSPADFAIRINGDSMEPYFPDGSVALCRKAAPQDGQVGAFLIDGEFLCKQFCIDYAGNMHLFSLNRERRDMDRTLYADDLDPARVMCFGTAILEQRLPLPLDFGG